MLSISLSSGVCTATLRGWKLFPWVSGVLFFGGLGGLQKKSKKGECSMALAGGAHMMP